MNLDINLEMKFCDLSLVLWEQILIIALNETSYFLQGKKKAQPNVPETNLLVFLLSVF